MLLKRRIFNHDRIIHTLLKRTTDKYRKLNRRLLALKPKILHLLPHFPDLNMCTHKFIFELLVFRSDFLNLFINKLKIVALSLDFLPTLFNILFGLVVCYLEVKDLLLHIVDDLEVLDGFLLGLMKLLVDVFIDLSLVYLGHGALVQWSLHRILGV